MDRVIGFAAVMLIFSLPTWARTTCGLAPLFTCNTLGNGQMDRAAGSIGVDAGRLVRPAVCGGLGSAAGARFARHGLPGDPGESTAGNTAQGK